MIRCSVEMFINNFRAYKSVSLKDAFGKLYPDNLSVGIETGLPDKDGKFISTNHFLTCKGAMCRLSIEEGQVQIRHPKFGLMPLWKYHKECKIVS